MKLNLARLEPQLQGVLWNARVKPSQDSSPLEAP
jgi:hypothetical protein